MLDLLDLSMVWCIIPYGGKVYIRRGSVWMGVGTSIIAVTLAGRINETTVKTDREGRFLSLLQFSTGGHSVESS